MRISDWSSDVCSSDLDALHEKLGELHELHIAKAAQYLAHAIAHGQLLARDAVVRIQAGPTHDVQPGAAQIFGADFGQCLLHRSEERRVGKECVSKCRSRWSPDP